MSGENDQTTNRRVSHDRLERFVYDVVSETGLEEDHAAILADALVTANLRGVDSHGVVRLEPYLRKLEAGGFNTAPSVSVSRIGSTVVVDADDGPGQVATVRAMSEAIETAEESGICFGTVQNSNHFGTAAYYTMLAADDDCIGVAMTNVGPNVAPYGGIDPFFGTNPLGFSIPTDRSYDITLDMATSVVAKGKIHIAEAEGDQIPTDWAIDENGDPTTDPESVHALRPVGGPKGYGLGILVDVCSGLLSGMGTSKHVDSLYEDSSDPQRIGHFVGAIDVSAFRDVSRFKSEVGALIDDLKSSRPRDGYDEIKLPGEIEAETRADREANGIPIGSGVVETLQEIGDRYDVEFPS